jgi:hypothetical protein
MLLTCTFAPATAAPTALGAACPGAGPVAEVGTVADPALVEVSGLAASRAHDGVLWAHNDSGAGPVLHALAPDGAALGAYDVPGATAVDWEDLGIGPGPDPMVPVLVVGDVGDNGAQRARVSIHRVAEPAAAPGGAGGALELLDTTEVAYPDGPVDVEALVVDPELGDVLLLTKDLLGASRVLRVPAERLGAGEVVSADDVGGFQVPIDLALGGGLPGTAVTAAEASPDGRRVLVRTYQAVLAFDRPAGEPLWAAFGSPPCRAPQADEAQGEAVAFTATGDAYLTIGEGAAAPVHRVELEAAPPPPTATSASPTPTAPAGSADPDDADGSARSTEDRGPTTVVVAAAAVLAALGLAAAAVRRRR